MNDTTKWIMIVLLLLLIAAAVVVLLRSPGKDRDGGDEAVDRVDDDRAGVQDSGGERLAAAPERGVYDQEADHREGGAHPVGQDEPVAAQEPSTYDRQTVGEDEPAVDEAPSQEPPASAGPGTSVDDSVTYADDIEATSGPEAAADRDATGDDDVAAEPYRPEAGAYEGGEPGTYAEESYRPGGGAGSAEPMADAEPGTAVEQHPTEELTAGDTEGYGGPAPVADTTPDGEPTPATDDDSDRLTQAARIGALGAAGGAVAGAATTGDGTASARPLSDEEVSAGARHEPLEVGDQEHPEGSTTSADEVAPDQSHDEPAADERTHDEPVVEERTHDEPASDERPV
ncbi:MAG TPA: hypothetical protein VLO09_09740, partial [Ornithinimicrobium sp.]|nr:hypothetical protein [Ornithinimicrobium sp.]